MKSFRMNRLSLAVVAAAVVGMVPAAKAVVVDTVNYTIAPTVIVWGANSTTDGPLAEDMYLLINGAGTFGTDIMTTNNVQTVVTGTLTRSNTALGAGLYTSYGDIVSPAVAATGVWTDAATTGYLNATDTYSSFGLVAGTDIGSAMTVRSSYYVASNTAFDVYVTSIAAVTETLTGSPNLTSITWTGSLTVSGNDGLAFGTNAQDPTGAGTGFAASQTLAAMTPPQKLFDGGQLTAASTGTISTQSVRFDNQYAFAYDLSMGTGSLSTTVQYTIYEP